MAEIVELRPMMLPLREASRRCGLPYSCLLRMVHEGRVPCIESGRRYYINYRTLCRILNGGDADMVGE